MAVPLPASCRVGIAGSIGSARSLQQRDPEAAHRLVTRSLDALMTSQLVERIELRGIHDASLRVSSFGLKAVPAAVYKMYTRAKERLAEQRINAALEADFESVLQELGADPQLERFRLEYETLYRALKKSHESEKRLVKKCKELTTKGEMWGIVVFTKELLADVRMRNSQARCGWIALLETRSCQLPF